MFSFNLFLVMIVCFIVFFFILVYRWVMDFGFLVDFVLDISDDNWEYILLFMCNVIDNLQDVFVLLYGIRIGIMSYVSVFYMYIDFNFFWGLNINKGRYKGLINFFYC